MSTTRRSVISSLFATVGLAAFDQADAAAAQAPTAKNAPISPKDNLKVTRLETFLLNRAGCF